MIKKQCLLFFMLLSSAIAVTSQDVKVYDHFEEFAPLLETNNDTTYVLNFWATWCKPCVEEMPYFIELNKKFNDSKFKMVLVNLDFKTQLETRVKPFIQNNSIDAKVIMLADSKQHRWIDKVNTDWSGSIPITIIYNKDFYFFREGSINFDELNEIITKNLIP